MENFLTIETVGLGFQGILCIAAILALKQISVAKKSFYLNSRRESIKLAADLIKEFRDKIIFHTDECDKILSQVQYTPFSNLEDLKEFKEDEVKGNKELYAHYLKTIRSLTPNGKDDFTGEVTSMMNSFEYFATPFVEKIADQKVAFNVVGHVYCRIIEKYYFAFAMMRNGKDDESLPYRNTILLYIYWSERIKKTKLESLQKKLGISLAGIKDREIIPIGTN